MARRRKNGTGTVRKRADGRWEGRVVIGYDDNGLPKTKNVLGKTKKECLEKLKVLQEQYTPPIRKCRKDMPFGDWIAFWYETYCKPQLSYRTQVGYEDRIYKHIIPEIGQIPLNKLTQNDLQQFYTRLKTSGRLIFVEQHGPGLSDRMVRVCHASCSAALKRAVQEGLIRFNPAAGCKLPPKKSGEMQILTQEEMQRFLIQAKQDGYYELFLLELGTGLRLGEILALQWKDLNFTTGELRITKSATFIDKELVLTEPKTKSSIRSIILPQSLLTVLGEYKKTVNSRWMFPSPVKEDVPIVPSYARRRMQQTPGTGPVQKGAVSRYASHLRHYGTGARHGCEDPVHDHWTRLLGNHAGYLLPRHRHDTEAGSGENRPPDRQNRCPDAPGGAKKAPR